MMPVKIVTQKIAWHKTEMSETSVFRLRSSVLFEF
jgi:hypothetical protein